MFLWKESGKSGKFREVVLRENISWVSRVKVSPNRKKSKIQADVGEFHARVVIENCASRYGENVHPKSRDTRNLLHR